MVVYLGFGLTLVLVIARFFRAGNFLEKSLFFTLFLFLILTFAMHPWIEKSYAVLGLIEKAALLLAFLWLAAGPVTGWLRGRNARNRALALLQNGKGPLAEIVTACRMLSRIKQGALIALERKDRLEAWVQSGITLDARIRKEMIYSIFTPPGALHDGGMIIRGERIAAAGVVFPLSKRLDLPTELGTRHRAGLGLSETTDALAIIISEETGKISLAVGAKLLYDVKPDRLPELLEASLKNKSPKHPHKLPDPKTFFSAPAPALSD